MIILTLTQKDKLSENLVNIMTEIEDEILHKIARQLAADNNISDTSKWRIRQLARSGQLKRESLELIKSYSGIQSESLYDALQTAAIEEVSNVDRSAREAIKNGLLSGSTDIPADRTAENALKAYYKQAKSDLNMVNTVMGYQASQAFVNAVNDVYGYVHKQLDKGTAKVVTGSESLQTAIRETIKDLSKHGIPAFVDKRGHHWSPESYVRMDLRTTLGNTANAAQWSRCDQFGINLISVDSHSGSRPLCAPYQGRIFSRDGTFGVTSDGSGKRIEYSPLSSTSYGQPAGLFGINCGHSSYPFIPGINIQRYFPVDPEENAARYKELQKQRQLEREIRAGKRECMMLQAAGDEEGYKKAALRLRTKREQYRVYSNAHDLSLHNDRTQVYGFDRSKSMKAVWAEKKMILSESYKITPKKSHNAFSVNRALVNSHDYHKKFDDLTPHKSANESIYNQSKRILEHRDGTEFESMSVINARTGELITDNLSETINNNSRTGLTKEQYDKVVQSKEKFILIHNHPASTRPSVTDILTLWKEKNATSSIIAGHDGSVFAISNINRKMPLDKMYEKAYNEYKEMGYTSEMAKIKATNTLYESGAFTIKEV